jgi:AcrR family transcriptional regulator
MPKVSPEYLAARRAQLVETAREVFSRKGLSETSMSDLVAASGMSIGGIYRYFASKDELIAAVAEGRDGTVQGGFPDVEAPGELLSRLLTYVSPPAGTEHARLVAQIWGGAAVQPALAEIVRTRHAALRDHLASRIRATGGGAGGVGGAVEDQTSADQGSENPAPEELASSTELAEVLLATLVGYSSVVAAGADLAPATFVRILERLL